MTVIENCKKHLAWTAGLTLSLYLFYTAGFGQVTPMFQMAFPLMMICIITFSAIPFSKKSTKTWHVLLNLIFLITSVSALVYIIIFEKKLAMRLGVDNTFLDVLISMIGIIVVVELCRRTTSQFLALLALMFFGYIFAGPYIPGKLGHSGFDLTGASVYMFLSQEGIFGTALYSMVSFIFIFILFGSVLNVTGAGSHIINFALALTGKITGGPAITAVAASSMFGTMSGSPVANVVGTGTLTIPLMKQTGYSKNEAGAIESVASTGGQLMPPIMGSSAFLMSELLGISYLSILVMAIIPALLFYFSVFLAVYFKARKKGLKGLPKEELPKIMNVLKEGGHTFLPIFILMFFLIAGFTPGYAAFYAIVSTIILSLLRKSTRKKPVEYIQSFVNAAKQSVSVFSALACVGIIIGSVSLTGLGVKFSILVVNVAGHSLLLALIYVAVSTVILGMGLPPMAGYLLVVVIAGSAIAQLGADLYAAHMFIFYFASIAVITPPVALAAIAAAGISGGSPMKTGFAAVRLGIVAFIIPFMFVFSPELLFLGDQLIDKIIIIVTATLGVILLSTSMEGFAIRKVPIWLRVLSFVGGIVFMISEPFTDLLGVAIFLLILIQQLWLVTKENKLSQAL